MKITRINVHPTRMALVHPYELSNAYGTLEASDQVLVEITTDEGIVGWGEGDPWPAFSGDTASSVVCVLRELLCPALIGRDPTNVAMVHQIMDSLISGAKMAKAAIDMACHDILGKALGVPVYKVLGGSRHDSIRCFWSIGGSTPEESAAEVLDVKSRGFWGCMVKVGTDYRKDAERVHAVRDAVGTDFPLIADANQGWDYETALRFGKAVEDAGLLFYEQPVKYWDVDSLAKLRRNLDIPISADEGISTVHDAIALIRADACDVFSIKSSKHGGILPTKRICELATAHGIRLFFNSMIEGGITQAASLNVATTCEIMQSTGHSFFSVLRHREDVTNFADLVVNGVTRMPVAPGLGIEVSAEEVARHSTGSVEIS